MKHQTSHSECHAHSRHRRQFVSTIGLAAIAFLSGCTFLSAGQSNKVSLASQRETVQQFYRTAIELQVFGLPSDAQINALSPWLSTQLMDLLGQATAAQRRELARHGGAEPPLVQGALLVSLFEGANRLLAVEPVATPHAWQVTLAYQQQGESVQWQDRVLLVNQPSVDGNRWVVDDIEFGGQWEFARSGRLSDLLQSVISQTRP